MNTPSSELDLELAKIICPDLLDTLTPQECHVMHPEIPKITALIDKQVVEAKVEVLESLPVSDYETVSDEGDETWFEFIDLDERDKQIATLKDTLKDKEVSDD